MYIASKYRRANHVGGVRIRLAKMLVAYLAKEGVEARCEAKNLWPSQGYWRQVEQDVYSWEGCLETKNRDNGKWMSRSLGSWDRMSSCVKGLTISGDGGFGFEVHATQELAPVKRFKIARIAAELAAPRR